MARVDALVANPANFRVHTPAQRAAMIEVLDRVGWVQQIIVNERTGRLLDGHLRVEIARERGERTVPAGYVDLSEDEERLMLASLDAITGMAEIDSGALDNLLDGLLLGDGAIAEMLAALDGRTAKPPPAPQLTDPDAVPVKKARPYVKRGRVYTLGRHRIMCGDATSADDHAALLDGAAIDLVLTDPPYGVGIEYESFVDTEENVAALVEGFMPLVLRWPIVLLTPGVAPLWYYPRPRWMLAWVHPAGSGIGPWGFTMLNPILAYGSDPYLKRGLGSRPDVLVLAADREGIEGHPVAKPVAVWEWVLLRGSPGEADRILDPFVGSGTTLIAAERTGRTAYCMELDPGYTQVAIERWEAFTGQRAQRAV